MSDASSNPGRSFRARLYGLLGIAAALGLLLWARLIVVSDLPRMAIAEEETPAVPETDAEESDANLDFGPEGEKSRPQVTEDRE